MNYNNPTNTSSNNNSFRYPNMSGFNVGTSSPMSNTSSGNTGYVYPTTTNSGTTGTNNSNVQVATQPQPVSINNNHTNSSGILPKMVLDEIDDLIDQLNASSGYNYQSVSQASSSNTHNNDPSGSSSNDNKSSKNNDDKSTSSASSSAIPVTAPPIRILCIGTNEGVPLSRSYGKLVSNYNNSTKHSNQNNISEEMLNSLETNWNILPSSISSHAMTASIAHQHSTVSTSTSTSTTLSYQPPHPILSHLKLGPTLKTTTLYHDNCIFFQCHFAPLVITILTANNVNVQFIHSFVIPTLKDILEPIRNLVLSRRIDLSMALLSNGDVVGVTGGGGGGGGALVNSSGGRVSSSIGIGGSGGGSQQPIIGSNFTKK